MSEGAAAGSAGGTWSYRPGSWFAVVGPGATLLLPPDQKERVVELWARIDDGADFGDVLDGLLASGLSRIPAFALIGTAGASGGATRVLVRGEGVRAVVDGDDGEVTVDGSGATTWSERSIAGVTACRLDLEDDADAADADADAGQDDGSAVDHTIVTGLVRVSRVDRPPVREAHEHGAPAIAVAADPAPEAVAADPAPEAVAAEPDTGPDTEPDDLEPAAGPDAEPEGEPDVAASLELEPEAESEGVAEGGPGSEEPDTGPPTEYLPPPDPEGSAAVEQPAEPAADPLSDPLSDPLTDPLPDAREEEPDDQPAPEAGDGPAAAATDQDASPVDDGWMSPPTGSPVPGAPAPPLPVGSWGSPPDASSPRPDLPPPPTGSDHDGLTRTGAVDPDEFARQQPGIPGQPPAPAVTRAVAKLLISNGEVVEVDRVVLIGRAPEARRFTSTEQPMLVTVPSPLHEISSTHVEVRPGSGADHGSAVVTDMGSTNGTVLAQPGLPPEDLKPGIAIQLIPGAIINLGDGVTIQVTRP